MKPAYIKLSIIAVLSAVACFLIYSAIPRGHSTAEVKLHARAAVFEAEMKKALAEAATLRIKAQNTEAHIQQLEYQLQQNNRNTNEKVDRIGALPPDSLARFIAADLVGLDKAWY